MQEMVFPKLTAAGKIWLYGIKFLIVRYILPSISQG